LRVKPDGIGRICVSDAFVSDAFVSGVSSRRQPIGVYLAQLFYRANILRADDQ
jgi:hypothetical protein